MLFQRLVQLWTLYVWPYLRIAFGGDKRSAALFRVALAITVLGDVVDRANDLEAHYTDAGVLPRGLVLEKFTNATWLSLHMWGGSWWAMAIMFAIHLMAATAMLVGWHSRKAAFSVWLLTTSLQSRNILVLHSGDVLLRLSLFWALFLPLGDVFSLDAAFKKRHGTSRASTSSSSPIRSIFASLLGSAAASESPSFEMERKEAHDRTFTTLVGSPQPSPSDRYSFINAGTLAVLMQVGLMYFTSVYHKTSDQWSVTGTATYFALQLDYFRMPMADLMLATLHPHLLPYFTFAVYYWEWLGSFCMVFPYKTGFMRFFGVVGYMFMHLGFGLCMRLATFFWAAEAALCVLLPAWFWDEFLFKYVLPKTPERTRFELFYTKRSLFRFHERFAKVVGTFCLFPETEVKPLDELRIDEDATDSYQDEEERGHNRSQHSGASARSFADLVDASLVAVDHQGHVHQDFRAVVSLCYASPVLWPLGWLLTRLTNSNTLSRHFVRFGFCLNVVVEACLHFVLGPRLHALRHDIKLKRASDRQDSADTGANQWGGGKRNSSFHHKKNHQRFSIRHLFTLRTMNCLLRNLFCLWLVYFVFGWNMNNIGVSRWVPKQGIRWVAYTLHIDQAWNMFSPHPPDASWWYIIEGTLVNEDIVEMHRDRGMFEWKGVPLNDWSPPASVPDTIGNHRWFKFYEQVNNNHANAAIRLHWGRYICREWNKRHGYYERVYEFKIWWLSRRVFLDGSRKDQPKQQLWHHVCYDTKPTLPAHYKKPAPQ